jgi:hypothetical protein
MVREIRELTAIWAILLASTVSSIPQVHAADDVNRGYDWTVRAETQELERYFEYTNSHLRPLDRIVIDYYPGENEKSSATYEKLWYHDGKPLGLERLQSLGVTRGENICLRITHHNAHPAPGEYKAAANAILRIWLDAHLNKNQLVVVKVPDAQSLDAIKDELTLKQNLIVVAPANAEDPQKTTMTLLIVSEADGQKVNLAYI